MPQYSTASPEAEAQPVPTNSLVELVDRYLFHVDALASDDLDPDDRNSLHRPMRVLGREIMMAIGDGAALTRGGRCLVPIGLGRTFSFLKVIRFRDLDIEEFIDTESRVLDACNRLVGAGPAARSNDLADVAGEIRRMTDCTEREALEAARALARLDPGTRTVQDLTDLFDLARTLLGHPWRGITPIVDGPPFEEAKQSRLRSLNFSEADIRLMMSEPQLE